MPVMMSLVLVSPDKVVAMPSSSWKPIMNGKVINSRAPSLI